MKRITADPVQPWRDRHPDGQEDEDYAAALIRGALQPGDPSEPQLARLEEQVLSRGRSRRHRRLALRLALAGLFLLVGGTSVEAARRMGWLVGIVPAWSPAPAPQQQQRPAAKLRLATRTPAVVVDIPAPLPEPSPVPAFDGPTAGGERPQRPMRMARRTAAAEENESPKAAPSDEISALDQAIRLLRRHRDAAAALSALDTYLVRYPQGVLNREARFARVDALLILQRPDQALDALENLPFDNHRRSTELQVIRGELRARSDCARAGQDFSAVLSRNPDNVLAERALYGRGACRVKQEDVKGATEDLQRYLERFPKGAHAPWARRWLESRVQVPKNGG